jgi:UPF0271 protein
MFVDLNSDLGESFGPYVIGNDAEVVPLVTSVNVACGFHGGDPFVIHRTIRLAKQHGTAVGAHPGYMDLHGFGRRVIPMSPDEVYDMVVYQLGALDAFLRVEGMKMHHVKPHGALYNLSARDNDIASAIAEAVYDYHKDLILYGLSGSALVAAGRRIGLTVAEEAFVDRHYNQDGSLVDRKQKNAFVKDAREAAERVVRMLQDKKVRTADGVDIPMAADTLCIHGDGPHAVAFAKAVRAELNRLGVELRPVQSATTNSTIANQCGFDI